MAHDHHTPNTTLHDAEQVVHEVTPTANTLLMFCVLVAIAALAFVVGFSDLGPWKVVASLAVATLEASVLAYFFMDLKQADSLTWLVALSGLFWVGLMFLFTLTDYLTRQMGVL